MINLINSFTFRQVIKQHKRAFICFGTRQLKAKRNKLANLSNSPSTSSYKQRVRSTSDRVTTKPNIKAKVLRYKLNTVVTTFFEIKLGAVKLPQIVVTRTREISGDTKCNNLEGKVRAIR